MKPQRYGCDSGIFVLAHDYEALEVECERLRVDAERYCWLRDRQADASDFCFASLEIYLPVPARGKGAPPRKHSECFDAAIDAARKEKA